MVSDVIRLFCVPNLILSDLTRLQIVEAKSKYYYYYFDACEDVLYVLNGI